MAKLAEEIVEEWMNRQRFLTIRGIKHGVHEVDLLGVRQQPDGIEAWHVEVSVSFRPIGYCTPMTKEYCERYGKGRTSAWHRPPEAVSAAVDAWVNKKFRSERKVQVRKEVWPGATWEHCFVHGEFRHPEEYEKLLQTGIKLIPFIDVLREVLGDDTHAIAGATGADLADIMGYLKKKQPEQ
jgi:hypothetical protein